MVRVMMNIFFSFGAEKVFTKIYQLFSKNTEKTLKKYGYILSNTEKTFKKYGYILLNKKNQIPFTLLGCL